jgi:hypothetical protein
VVVVYKIWWAYVGTVSDFATLLRHNTTTTTTPAVSPQTLEHKKATPLRKIGVFNYPLHIAISQKTEILNMKAVISTNVKNIKICSYLTVNALSLLSKTTD